MMEPDEKTVQELAFLIPIRRNQNIFLPTRACTNNVVEYEAAYEPSSKNGHQMQV
jgi:hypothetical protein